MALWHSLRQTVAVLREHPALLLLGLPFALTDFITAGIALLAASEELVGLPVGWITLVEIRPNIGFAVALAVWAGIIPFVFSGTYVSIAMRLSRDSAKEVGWRTDAEHLVQDFFEAGIMYYKTVLKSLGTAAVLFLTFIGGIVGIFGGIAYAADTGLTYGYYTGELETLYSASLVEALFAGAGLLLFARLVAYVATQFSDIAVLFDEISGPDGAFTSVRYFRRRPLSTTFYGLFRGAIAHGLPAVVTGAVFYVTTPTLQLANSPIPVLLLVYVVTRAIVTPLTAALHVSYYQSSVWPLVSDVIDTHLTEHPGYLKKVTVQVAVVGLLVTALIGGAGGVRVAEYEHPQPSPDGVDTSNNPSVIMENAHAEFTNANYKAAFTVWQDSDGANKRILRSQGLTADNQDRKAWAYTRDPNQGSDKYAVSSARFYSDGALHQTSEVNHSRHSFTGMQKDASLWSSQLVLNAADKASARPPGMPGANMDWTVANTNNGTVVLQTTAAEDIRQFNNWQNTDSTRWNVQDSVIRVTINADTGYVKSVTSTATVTKMSLNNAGDVTGESTFTIETETEFSEWRKASANRPPAASPSIGEIIIDALVY